MKATFFLSFFTLLFFVSCNDDAKTIDKNAVVYTGDFAGSPLVLSLVHLADSNVKGTSKHKGQNSDLSGRLTASPKGYVYKLRELGTSRFEGTFDLELDTALNIVFGSWQQADTTGGKEVVIFTLLPQ
ncbi:MAG: hypothetical protein IT256_08145 [Chitinophagaceae bacterium]|nr:hypothetical protein [Chitinophagaceae bacterium]